MDVYTFNFELLLVYLFLRKERFFLIELHFTQSGCTNMKSTLVMEGCMRGREKIIAFTILHIHLKKGQTHTLHTDRWMWWNHYDVNCILYIENFCKNKVYSNELKSWLTFELMESVMRIYKHNFIHHPQRDTHRDPHIHIYTYFQSKSIR